MLNSRITSLLLALSVGVVTTSILSLLNEISAVVLITSFLLSFSSSFILFYLTLEVLVYRELRKIYKIFDKYTEKKNKRYKHSEISVKKMGKILFAYADKKQNEIERLQKLETFRREFLADISHELKTPVFAAQGFIHTLLDGAIDDPNVSHRFLKKSAKSLDDLNNLVQDLIIISQMESGEIILKDDQFDMTELIVSVIEQLEGAASKKSILINTEFNDEHFYTKGDYFRLNQVMTNLINNAIMYGNEQGTITVILNKKKEKNQFEVIVKDNGPGIAEEHHPRIFQRFYKVDKSRSREKGGTGLGLSIVKHIVEAHDSEIKLVSKTGKGCKFSFKLKLDK